MEKIIFEDLPSTKTPLNAHNLNKIQENAEVAIDGIDNKFNYSTEEQVIGTWINGEPIYRLVVEYTLGDAINTYKDVVTIPNIKQMINAYGWFTNVDTQFNIPRSYDGEEITFYLDQKNQRIREKHNYTYANDLPAYITLEYTKTID